MSRICDHAGWGQYPGETGPSPKPAEMTGPCEHNTECPVCKFRITISPCGHETINTAVSYRVAVNRPMEMR